MRWSLHFALLPGPTIHEEGAQVQPDTPGAKFISQPQDGESGL